MAPCGLPSPTSNLIGPGTSMEVTEIDVPLTHRLLNQELKRLREGLRDDVREEIRRLSSQSVGQEISPPTSVRYSGTSLRKSAGAGPVAEFTQHPPPATLVRDRAIEVLRLQKGTPPCVVGGTKLALAPKSKRPIDTVVVPPADRPKLLQDFCQVGRQGKACRRRAPTGPSISKAKSIEDVSEDSAKETLKAQGTEYRDVNPESSSESLPGIRGRSRPNPPGHCSIPGVALQVEESDDLERVSRIQKAAEWLDNGRLPKEVPSGFVDQSDEGTIETKPLNRPTRILTASSPRKKELTEPRKTNGRSRSTIRVGDHLVKSSQPGMADDGDADAFEEGHHVWSSVSARTRRWANDAGDFLVAFAISLNGLFFGLQTAHMTDGLTEDSPVWYIGVEIVFLVFFTVEIIVRLAVNRHRFFYTGPWQWNIFDFVLVLLQLVDVFVEVTVGRKLSELQTAQSVKNVAFVRVLRVMRILRVLRLARLLQFVGELSVVTHAIIGSMRALLGTLLLLLLLVYCVGIFFTQVVTAHRVRSIQIDQRESDPRLRVYWGSLWRTMLTLFESCFGGLDWDDAVMPLTDISEMMAVSFVLFIAFVLIAMMNIITGIFVESAIRKAESVKATSLRKFLKGHLCFESNENSTQNMTIERSQLQAILDNPHTKTQLLDYGVDANEAELLFEFLRRDDAETVDANELLAGMIRLRIGTRFIDTLTLLASIRDVQVQMREALTDFDGAQRDVRRATEATAEAMRLVAHGGFANANGMTKENKNQRPSILFKKNSHLPQKLQRQSSGGLPNAQEVAMMLKG
eukprot:TRINITY_DN19507_c0_g1_i2.p1 TRINITY_DN19507_c0_g1~~TRINITY_DN19507_c0_g1_i2.p1  ORF type:complete len:814 (+),score=149.24 TRINITY_DN19507_c0_g1_i2:42-2444(+)